MRGSYGSQPYTPTNLFNKQNEVMENLITTNNDGVNVTTSLKVAEIFSKRHDHVLRDIQNLSCSSDFRLLNFGESSYFNSQNKKQPMYEITKDGFSFLVMGYSGEKAGQFKETFINEFNKRESLLSSDDFILSKALSILDKRTKALEADNKEKDVRIAEMRPKEIFADSTSASKDTILIKELAGYLKQSGIDTGQNRLFDWMRQNGFLCGKGDYYNLPTQKALDLKLFEVEKTTINKPNGDIIINTTTKVTGKGQVYFVNKFLNA